MRHRGVYWRAACQLGSERPVDGVGWGQDSVGVRGTSQVKQAKAAGLPPRVLVGQTKICRAIVGKCSETWPGSVQRSASFKFRKDEAYQGVMMPAATLSVAVQYIDIARKNNS